MINVTEQKDLVYLAFVALDKNYTKKSFKESSYMIGNENHLERVWDIVVEARKKGPGWFRDYVKSYNLNVHY